MSWNNIRKIIIQTNNPATPMTDTRLDDDRSDNANDITTTGATNR